jgi:hypothetical protein
MNSYEIKFRVNGGTSVTQVQAHNASQAKKLVQTMYDGAVVIHTKQLH